MRKKGENDEGAGGAKGAGDGDPPKKKKKDPTSDASTESEAFKCPQSGPFS